MLHLYKHSKEAVPFLKDKLKPLAISSARVMALIGKLNSTDEHVRKPAFEELEYFDPRLAIGLEELMKRVTESPARQRMVEILSERNAGWLAGKDVTLLRGGDYFNFRTVQRHVVGRRSGRPDQFRAVANSEKEVDPGRAPIVLLEHIRTPEAVAILRDMAGGHVEAKPTRVAKERSGRFRTAR